MQPQDHPTRITVFAREEPPTPARERIASVRGRLRQLADDGVVADLREREWPSRVPADGPERPEVAIYREFAEWADGVGVTLDPYFHTRVCYQPGTTTRGEWLVLPVLSLAIYRDGRLARVYPHAKGGRHRTVQDGLDALGAGRDPDRRDRELVAD